MDVVRVRLLGGFEVDGIDDRHLGSRKARALLKALALERGRPLSSDALTEILWPERLPARPADDLQVLVSRLRAVLGADRLVRSDAGYTLRCDWLDLDELDGRVDEAEARLVAGRVAAARAAATSALRLARGPLLPEEDGEWFVAHRPAVERTVARARLVAATASLALGDAPAAAADAEAALDRDPYDETALRLLMRAHAAAGRPASGLAAYARARVRLSEDLGVDPTAETEALHTALLLGPADGRVDRGAGISADLVGRTEELAVLDAELAMVEGGPARAVVVEGEAGIGKSALMAAWAARLRSGGTLVLLGRCDELGRDLPLQPVLDAFAALFASLDTTELDHRLGPHRRLLEELLGLVDDVSPLPTVLADPVAGQTRLFGALVDVVGRAGAGSPVVLMIEDLHLAGPSTVAWLRFALRRAQGLLVVATRRGHGNDHALPGRVLPLAPLDLAEASTLLGPERAAALHERSGGNPLFLLELSRAVGGELPATVVDAVRVRVAALGEAAATIRVAAVLGLDVDVDLLAACSGRGFLAVLDDLETASAAGLVVERGEGFAFTHDVVREALAADMPAARRAYVHREAARALRARNDRQPLDTAFHAQRAGETVSAAAALLAGAEVAAARFDLDVAQHLLDQAIALADDPAARLARARVRMARLDHAGAAADIAAVLGPDAGADAFELAGWIAYYRRDHDEARRCADEAIRRSVDPAVRAGALALGGRIRHAAGELVEADRFLTEAAELGAPPEPGVAHVWLASLRVHQGSFDAAVATLGSLAPTTATTHPFAVFHGLFARALAHGLAGRLGPAFVAAGELDGAARRLGDQGLRFVPIAENVRGWLLRATGRPGDADVHNRRALELSTGVGFEEPRAHARLDLAEGRLRAGDGRAAGDLLAEVVAGLEPGVTMAWHIHQRVLWLEGRRLLSEGAAEAAGTAARELMVDAAHRGSARYGALGDHLDLVASAVLGHPVDDDAARRVLIGTDHQAGIDAWWLAAELAVATASEMCWRVAQESAARLLAGASGTPDVDQGAMQRWLDEGLASFRARWPRASRPRARGSAPRRAAGPPGS